jgi:hypothetical protein
MSGSRACNRAALLSFVHTMAFGSGTVDVKKIVDVFLQDRLVASYPVVVEVLDPTDDDFIEIIKRHMRRQYSEEDTAVARFIVRGLLS